MISYEEINAIYKEQQKQEQLRQLGVLQNLDTALEKLLKYKTNNKDYKKEENNSFVFKFWKCDLKSELSDIIYPRTDIEHYVTSVDWLNFIQYLNDEYNEFYITMGSEEIKLVINEDKDFIKNLKHKATYRKPSDIFS